MSESSVQALISEIRQALDDGSRSIIRTVHGVGYAFGTDITEVAKEVRAHGVRAWLLADTWKVPLTDGGHVRLGSVLFTFRLARGVNSTYTQAVEHTGG